MKDVPAPPDYVGAAEATAASDREMLAEQTRANRPNQFTPFGSSVWNQNAEGDWAQYINLDPEAQQSLDNQQAVNNTRSGTALGMLGRMEGEYGSPMDWNKFQEYAGPIGGSQHRQAAEDAAYGSATSRLDPRFGQMRESTEAQLRNQGLKPGDEAYDTAMGNLGRTENDAYNQAMFSSIREGGAEGQRDQSMDLTGANYQNTLRQSQVAEEMQRRGFSLNEINALLSGQQVGMPSMPGFTAAGRSQGVDYTGAASAGHQANMDVFSAEQAQMQMLMEGAGSAAMMFSDVRLKRNIQFASIYKGRFWYVWDWVWGGRGQGVIAQENLDIAIPHESGYLMVDYGRI
jgi:hypothetical protein